MVSYSYGHAFTAAQDTQPPPSRDGGGARPVRDQNFWPNFTPKVRGLLGIT
jgi:hypothetical protein